MLRVSGCEKPPETWRVSELREIASASDFPSCLNGGMRDYSANRTLSLLTKRASFTSWVSPFRTGGYGWQGAHIHRPA
jgi:hypothetical protein